MNIRNILFENADLKYKEFHSKLMPTVAPDNVIGVRIPVLRKIAKEFEKGVFSLTEPKNTEVFLPEKIDCIIVPGIAFSLGGARVGFGKGCYDVFLSKTRAVKIGFCYDFQLCERIETDAFDIGMDYILTENKLIKVEG